MTMVTIQGDTVQLYSIDECESNALIYDTTRFVGLTDCAQFIFSDCDNSVTNDRTDNHGEYEIIVNGNTAAFGGYYANSETNIICVNNSYHVSFCKIPQFCDNRTLFLSSGEDIVSLTSYQSVVNSELKELQR